MATEQLCGKNFNVIYDLISIEATASYLSIAGVEVSESSVLSAVLEGALYNADFAEENECDEKWQTVFNKDGYVIIYTFEGYTKKNGFPILSAEIYVIPHFSNCEFAETEIRG